MLSYDYNSLLLLSNIIEDNMEKKHVAKKPNKNGKKKAVVFIDGNNFYHNINLTSRINKMGIKAGHIDYLKLSEAICSHFGVVRKKTKYYNSVPNVEDGKEMYWKHMDFLNGLRELPRFEVITRKLQRSSTRDVLKEKDAIVSNLSLCGKCEPLVKTNCYDCVGNVKKREKGIDVKIAVDMVEYAIKNKCDCIILISGDSDFIPALKIVEDNGKDAHSAFLKFGYSFDIRDNFNFLIISRDFITDKCLKDGVI